MEFEFDLEWCLTGAKYLTPNESARVNANPTDGKAIDALILANKSYIHSINVLNDYCKPQMAEYRKSVVKHEDSEIQSQALDKLYSKYLIEFKKHKMPLK
ncbi:hypothetical protein TVAG_454330 [Trichomonas vaginalis G3]|uniref:Uncharacterized protein n=1 Tax=Trichomonas vaginalis (strain ATCC PRA-98 / G3) TaxID=412133 RepID=A2EU46_TRIV3|nr:hypothetical protein TVAGG3_0230960 [Trichomonas vaginalis G3]EAY03794.1 hypothetical protein TVAG_454330 [Trichomonas vaginalis G3]KAI5552623.1 hypothetical protein TVAGG3_0230960 [Trichomonas vaginalis G3]|eukprot:XP_001316017.1 hypothetical protein [Trichomonas vaginalis G3]